MHGVCAVVAVLPCADVKATAAYYRDVLGFTIDETYVGDAWTMLWADQCQLFLSHDPDAARRSCAQLLITVADVDAIYAEHRRRGASVVRPIEDKPWGLREYTLADRHGNLLRIAMPV